MCSWSRWQKLQTKYVKPGLPWISIRCCRCFSDILISRCGSKSLPATEQRCWAWTMIAHGPAKSHSTGCLDWSSHALIGHHNACRDGHRSKIASPTLVASIVKVQPFLYATHPRHLFTFTEEFLADCSYYQSTDLPRVHASAKKYKHLKI